MDKNLQRIIAKEGLIVLGIIVITRLFTIPQRYEHHDRFLSSVILWLFIYEAIRFILWAIVILGLKPKIIPAILKKYKNSIMKESLILIVALICFWSISLYKPVKEFDLSSAMTVTEDLKVEVTETNKPKIEKLLGRSISGMSEQQVQSEAGKQILKNKTKKNVLIFTNGIVSILYLLGSFGYPIYAITRIISWLIKRNKK